MNPIDQWVRESEAEAKRLMTRYWKVLLRSRLLTLAGFLFFVPGLIAATAMNRVVGIILALSLALVFWAGQAETLARAIRHDARTIRERIAPHKAAAASMEDRPIG